MADMGEELMEEERIACEAESDTLWLEAEAYPHQVSIRLILIPLDAQKEIGQKKP